VSTPAPVLTVVRVLGVAVAVTAVLLGAVGVANSFARAEAEESFSATGVEVVRVRVDTGRVRVERVPGPAVEVTVSARGTWRTPRTDQQQDGGALLLESRCGDAALIGRCEVSYSIGVPDGVDVDVAAAAGRVDVDGVDGEVTARVDAGRVQLRGVRSRLVQASTEVGRVSVVLSEVPDRVVVTTATGEVEVVVPPRGAPYAVEASTDVGTARVEVPDDPASPRSIRARADVGDVTVRGG
jgi:hypothetical protein